MKYVVQRFESPADGVGYWVDIATIEVEPRTKRSTVIKKALADMPVFAGEGAPKPRLRALDAESAEVFEPEAYQPPVEWKLP